MLIASLRDLPLFLLPFAICRKSCGIRNIVVDVHPIIEWSYSTRGAIRIIPGIRVFL
jgi:hypothetical protein